MCKIPVYVIIPAYEPDERMLNAIREIKEQTDYNIIVVNDGSSNEKSGLFIEASVNAALICHGCNKGKGRAIKTALSAIQKKKENCIIVVADADGQHKTEDIIRVAEAAADNRSKLVLGCRKFTGKVPFRSRFGNSITRGVFRLVSGRKLSDTQTGLRGFSEKLIPLLLKTKGERYEFEMNVLLECAAHGIGFYEVPIETVYINNNEGSHFDPIKDSFIIYKDILKFAFSSFSSFIIDYCLYSAIFIASGSLLAANICSRTISSVFNYSMNKRFVFGQKGRSVSSALKYFGLCLFILISNTIILKLLCTYLIPNALIAKIITEVLLFFISWTAQKQFVFKKEVTAL